MRYNLIRADVEIWHHLWSGIHYFNRFECGQGQLWGRQSVSVKQHSKLIEVSVVVSSTVCLIFRHLLTVNRIVQGFPSIIQSHTVSCHPWTPSVLQYQIPWRFSRWNIFKLTWSHIYLSALGTDTLGFETQKRVIVFLFLSECFKFYIRQSLPEIRNHRRTCWMPQS